MAVFEKARAKRAANRATAATSPPPTPPEPAAPPPAPAAPAPAAKPREARTDKVKKRGHLVRPGTANAAQHDPEEEYEPPRTGYMNFVII